MLRLTPCQRDECFFWRLSKFVFYSAPTEVSIENKDKRRFGGGIQRGRCPLCVVVGVGFIGEGPHRKGPFPMRFFGYFLSVQKVTRGSGVKPLMVSKRKWNIRGARRIKISYFVAAGAVEEKFVDKEKNRWEIKKNLSTGVCGKSGGSSTAFHRTGCDRNFPQAGCKTFWGNGGKLRG